MLLQITHCMCSSLEGKINSYTARKALSAVRPSGTDRTGVYAIADYTPQVSARQSNMLYITNVPPYIPQLGHW